MQYYYIGLGSNVAPYENFPRMLQALQALSPELALSSIITTIPKGMVSTNPFLNAVVRIVSDLPADALKAQFNAIEAKLGRDRSDPNRSFKDRTADLDILFATPLDTQYIPLQHMPPEPYMNRPLADLLYFLGIHSDVPKPQLKQTAELFFRGHLIGNHPIYFHQTEVKNVK